MSRLRVTVLFARRLGSGSRNSPVLRRPACSFPERTSLHWQPSRRRSPHRWIWSRSLTAGRHGGATKSRRPRHPANRTDPSSPTPLRCLLRIRGKVGCAQAALILPPTARPRSSLPGTGMSGAWTALSGRQVSGRRVVRHLPRSVGSIARPQRRWRDRLH
jgi:hypothetical protein